MNDTRKRVVLVTLATTIALLTTVPLLAQSTCPAANPNDGSADDAAINACIAAGGTVTLVSGTPGYIISTGLVLATSNVVLQGAPGTKPLLSAHPDLQAPMLLVPQNPYPTGFVIRDLAFDGRKDFASTARASNCTGDKHKGYNLQISGAFWTIERVDSDNTLCGSAMEVECNGCTVRNNRIRNSGTPYSVSPHRVADGLTIAFCINGDVRSNEIANGTDVNLIVGPGSNCRVTENWIWQTVLGQVGLMIGFAGDHSGSRVDHNLVQSVANGLAVGLMVGDHPWNVNGTMVHAGLIDFNDVQGATILAAIDGILAGTFVDNVGSNPQGVFPIPNCAPWVYTAGHHGSATLQGGWGFQTYHNGACQW